jgi:NADPH:quinone reductase-like Zn-dependent oxidoreductase
MRCAVAARYGKSSEVLSLVRDCAPPRPPRGNELLVRLVASSINPIDSWMMRGYGRQLFPLLGVEPPLTPGVREPPVAFCSSQHSYVARSGVY